ncbi:helix-turn-helix domain-containing protein [Arabiibacter massiliensis]|uniref:helix-turn-helix domain-containing protein n=1 Tax=Arabiibacter massiliensis TaxID=1870985 RepID=UPI0009BADE28|nr:helix-turn-helix transcriptional regulator [Arabiibacter massiliensis]
MIRAYDKLYLEKARAALARMLDFAVNDLGYDLARFFDLFIRSDMAKRFEEGDFSVLAGKSGVEIAYEVLEQVEGRAQRVKPTYSMERSAEYWAGWALAYYQWETALPFEDIVAYVPIVDIRALYSPYHEMDIRQFVDKMNEMRRAAKPDTNLKMRRRKAGLSQKELAELSGVPKRTIQQYEQRQKDINKAQVEYVLMLAKALACEPADLIEHA